MGVKRRFRRKFKLSVLNDLETRKLAEVCREHNLAPSTVCGWKKSYESNPKAAFKGSGNIWKEDAKIARYERIIGQQCVEIAFLKKACERLRQLQAEEKRKERSLLR